jgi:molecular chaperone GrpE
MEEKDLPIQEELQSNQKENCEENEQVNIENPLENQLNEQKDKFLRLFAEFDNYKKRVAKERLELFATAGKDIIIEFLPIIDDFERAIKSNENSEDLSAIKEGMLLIYDKMLKSFERKGVKKVIAKGERFDADMHEAITEIPVIDESQKGLVIDEIESGYMLNDKMIRFSKVVVGK